MSPGYALTLIDVSDESTVTDEPPVVPYLPFPGLDITHGYAEWRVVAVKVDTQAPAPLPEDEFGEGPLRPAPWPVTAMVHIVR